MPSLAAGRAVPEAVVTLVLTVLRELQDEGWRGLQIDRAGLGDARSDG